MSTEEYIKVSVEDLDTVQNLVEQCLVHYMTQKEVIRVLYQLQNINPIFTETVWQRLEEQNPEFFKSYHLRLALNEQIADFNKLLGRQAALMNQMDPRFSFPPVCNVSHMPSMYPNGSCCVPDNGIGPKMENNMQHSVPMVLMNGYNNCDGPFIQSGMQNGHGVNGSATHSRRIDLPSNNMLLARNSNIGMMDGFEIKNEPGYLENSRLVYQSDGIVIGAHHPTIDHASISPFGGMDPNLQNLFRQISQNNGMPGLAADFTNPDILAFSNSAFVLPYIDNFYDSQGITTDREGPTTYHRM